MTLSLVSVHEHARTTLEDGSMGVKLVRVNPYLRLTAEGQGPIFIQGGVAYWDGDGGVADPIPEWVYSEAEKVSERVKKETGLDLLLEKRKGTVQSLDSQDEAEESLGGSKKKRA